MFLLRDKVSGGLFKSSLLQKCTHTNTTVSSLTMTDNVKDARLFNDESEEYVLKDYNLGNHRVDFVKVLPIFALKYKGKEMYLKGFKTPDQTHIRFEQTFKESEAHTFKNYEGMCKFMEFSSAVGNEELEAVVVGYRE